MEDIFFWTRHDKHGYCSNFYRATIEIDGKVYPTTEHYFQASKTLLIDEHEMIRNLLTPGEAKFAGYHVTLRPGWEEMKEGVMLEGLRAKFTQHPNLREKLLSTGEALLHENSPWDKYWGYAQGKGLDRLGQLLMQVREELRSRDYPSTILTVEGIKRNPTISTSVLREFDKRCGAYAECWEELGKPEGWPGCSLPKGHEGDHRNEGERIE